MPCMGPDVNYKEVENALNDTLDLLREKYSIFKYSRLPSPFDLEKYRNEAIQQLKKGIYEVFLQQACEDF